MNDNYIIRKAILSEKAYKLMEKGVYMFLVNQQAEKSQIAKAVEKQFSVTVEKVNVEKAPTKQKRIGKTRKFTTIGGGKKAIVYLKSGQTIAMLSPKTESKGKKSKGPEKSLKDKDVQVVSAEGKEG